MPNQQNARPAPQYLPPRDPTDGAIPRIDDESEDLGNVGTSQVQFSDQYDEGQGPGVVRAGGVVRGGRGSATAVVDEALLLPTPGVHVYERKGFPGGSDGGEDGVVHALTMKIPTGKEVAPAGDPQIKSSLTSATGQVILTGEWANETGIKPSQETYNKAPDNRPRSTAVFASLKPKEHNTLRDQLKARYQKEGIGAVQKFGPI